MNPVSSSESDYVLEIRSVWRSTCQKENITKKKKLSLGLEKIIKKESLYQTVLVNKISLKNIFDRFKKVISNKMHWLQICKKYTVLSTFIQRLE